MINKNNLNILESILLCLKHDCYMKKDFKIDRFNIEVKTFNKSIYVYRKNKHIETLYNTDELYNKIAQIIYVEMIMKEIKMKKLNIKNEYKDKNIEIILEHGYIKVGIVSKNHQNFHNIQIRVGNEFLTINQANQILKVMNLPYELVDEIDWNNIKVGTKIKYNRTPFSHKESSVGQFHSYIKELNKITIIDGYDIIAKDVNECEIIN